MTVLTILAVSALAASALIQLVWLFRRDGAADPVSHWALLLAAALLAATTVARSFQIGFPALTGTFESLVFYAAMVCAVCFAYRVQKKLPFARAVQFGATFFALVLLAVASSPLAPKDALAPIPALRSLWLLAHVALSFVGEAFFVAAFVASILQLATKDAGKREDFDRITYTAIAVGFPIFTAGALVFGAIWAERAWGSWWSWDPKETWALVTWLVYTAYLHVRLTKSKKGPIPAWISVLGFLCTVFTFFGVNYLLPGLHSYG
ncbi:MAG: cytochrome c biogenesis protein CcsA [Spirochaetaceae bacterium]|nr:cytochrome c biogenesis protein CcsA [Spirochaetaceae bacterium]